LIGLQPAIDIYDAWLRAHPDDSLLPGARLLEHALSILNVRLGWQDSRAFKKIPRKGPVVVVANHPLGGLEGMLLTKELLKHRRDTKVLTNELLLRMPEFADIFIGLDVLSEEASSKNTRGVRAACRHLDAGGTLLIFPAGTVASIRPGRLRIEDGHWHNLVGRLARRYQAACLPVHVEARNSRLFYVVGLLHKRLRTVLLPWEMAHKRNSVIKAYAGEVVNARDVEELGDPDLITRYLRLSSDMLSPASRRTSAKTSARPVARLAPDIDSGKLRKRLAMLESYQLVNDAVYSVYCAPYDALGCLMDQIAVDRERTFRAVDEGTGRELDSDHFDPYYWHLWVWNKEKNELVGAYRVGKIDEIITRHGIGCLYSRSLYEFNQAFIRQLGSAIEVGRSFVTLPYQRHPKSLDLLWRGIGAFMVRNPSYHTLFGSVSISRQYSALAHAFLADTMMKNFCVSQEWLQHVRPQEPLRVSGRPWTPEILASLNNITAINKLLGNLDGGKRMPILLRHYLALNGRFASFTVNKGFNHSLDGLIIVDLRTAPEKYLNRYLGKEGSQLFLQRWTEDAQAA